MLNKVSYLQALTIICVRCWMNLINISKKMKEYKYLLLGLSFFFFNISFASCRNQKTAAVVQNDSVEENESENSNLLELIRSHKYIYGGVRMAMDTLLPSNRGCLGFTSEEGLPICLSFRHHANGEPGRFSVISVYDEKGKFVKEMSLEGYGGMCEK